MPEDKPVRRKIKTVGDLRGILAQAIEDVISGDLDVHKATAVVKLASQLNASLLAEIEVARFTMVQSNVLAALGSLPLDYPAAGAKHPLSIEHEAAPVVTVAADKPIQSVLAPRVNDYRPSGGVVDMPGMPPPGRSALDQRRAAS